jgi:protein required for attachment to host cells
MHFIGKVQDDLTGVSKRSPVIRPHKSPRTWIMVVDQHIARIFEKTGKGLEPIGEAIPDLMPKPEITNHSVGRTANSGDSSIRSKLEPHMNQSQEKNLAFIHQISDWLDKAVWQDAFDRIVIIAAPRTLGYLRNVLKREVHARIVAEINKDLTKFDVAALQDELKKIIWF